MIGYADSEGSPAYSPTVRRDALYESLESRQLLSVSLNPATNVLTVTGTSGDDTIKAVVVGITLRVTDNHKVSNFPVAKVARIVINAGAGDDAVTLDPTVRIGATIDSGPGGEAGNGTTPGDQIQGGGGNDTIYLEADFSGANGAAGDDTIVVTGGLDGAN